MTRISKLDVRMLVRLFMRLIVVMIWHCFLAFGVLGVDVKTGPEHFS